jgi:hypothetical protein
MVYLSYYPNICLKKTRDTMNNLRTAGNSADIHTE